MRGSLSCVSGFASHLPTIISFRRVAYFPHPLRLLVAGRTLSSRGSCAQVTPKKVDTSSGTSSSTSTSVAEASMVSCSIGRTRSPDCRSAEDVHTAPAYAQRKQRKKVVVGSGGWPVSVSQITSLQVLPTAVGHPAMVLQAVSGTNTPDGSLTQSREGRGRLDDRWTRERRQARRCAVACSSKLIT